MPYGFGSRESHATIRRSQSSDQCAISPSLANRHLFLDTHKVDGRSGSLHTIHGDGSGVLQLKKKSSVKKIRSLGIKSSEARVVNGCDLVSGGRKFSLTSLGKRLSTPSIRKSRLKISSQVTPRSPLSPAEGTNRIRSLIKRKPTGKISAPAAFYYEKPEEDGEATALPAKSLRGEELHAKSLREEELQAKSLRGEELHAKSLRGEELHAKSNLGSKTPGRKVAKSMHDEECHSDNDDDVIAQGAGGGWGGLSVDSMMDDGGGGGDPDANGDENNEITMGSRDIVPTRQPAMCTPRTPDAPVANWGGWGSDEDSDDNTTGVATSHSVMITSIWSQDRSEVLPSISSPSGLNEMCGTQDSGDTTLSTQGLFSRFKKKGSRPTENEW